MISADQGVTSYRNTDGGDRHGAKVDFSTKMLEDSARVPPPLLIDAAQIATAISINQAVDALEVAFATNLSVAVPNRTQLRLDDATFLVMPAVNNEIAGRHLAGVKAVTVRPSNDQIGAPTIHASYLLFGGQELSLLAVINGSALTTLRTAAVSALATRYLARRARSRLVIFGAGAQARGHLAALAATCELSEVVVVARRQGHAQELVTAARRLGFTARTGTPDDLRTADIVCCCTTARTPLFDGTLVRPGTHIIAVGAYEPDARELDEATMLRSKVVVEDRGVATAEAGELAIPIAAGRYAAADISADLREVCSGTTVRTRDSDITVFKSVGTASEDLAVASALYVAIHRSGF